MAHRESGKFSQTFQEVDGRNIFTVPGHSSQFEWKLTPGNSALLWTDSDYDVLENCQEIHFDDMSVAIDLSGQITTKLKQIDPKVAESVEETSEAPVEPVKTLQDGATEILLSDYVSFDDDHPPLITKAWATHGQVEILQNGNLSYLPDEEGASKDSITFIVHDGHWSTEVMKIRVENQVPIQELGSQLIPNQFDGIDTYVNLDIGGYLSDLMTEDNVVINVAGLPPGLSYNSGRMHIEGQLTDDGSDGQTHTVLVSITTAAGQTLSTQFKWIIQPEKALETREAVTRAVPPISTQSEAAAAAVLYSVASQASLAARGFSLSSQSSSAQANTKTPAAQLDLAKVGTLTGESGQNQLAGSEAQNLFDLSVETPTAQEDSSDEVDLQLDVAGSVVKLSRDDESSQTKTAPKSEVDLEPDTGVDTGTTGPGDVNEAPFAGTPPMVGTPEDVALTGIDVLAAAYDPDGDTLTITAASATSGSVNINADGTLDYTPNPDFNGPDVISYTLDDGNGNTTDGALAVNVVPVNDAPIAGPTVSGVTDEDVVLGPIDVLSAATDIDGDTLSVISATALNGTVAINPDSTLGYTPNPDYVGADTITYTISDGNGGTDTSTYDVTVNPVNDAPRPTADSAVVNEDGSVVVNVLTNDTDIDGTIDPTTVQITGTASPGDPLVVAGEGTWSVNTTTGEIEVALKVPSPPSRRQTSSHDP